MDAGALATPSTCGCMAGGGGSHERGILTANAASVRVIEFRGFGRALVHGEHLELARRALHDAGHLWGVGHGGLWRRGARRARGEEGAWSWAACPWRPPCWGSWHLVRRPEASLGRRPPGGCVPAAAAVGQMAPPVAAG